VPLEKLNLLGGIVDTLTTVLGRSGIGWLVVSGLGIGFLYTLFATMVTWLIGTGRMVSEAAGRDGFPAIFGWRHPQHGSPIGASLLTGIISTLVLVIYGSLAGRDEELFWSLFSFASIVFLLPYLLLFPAFLKLRQADPKTRRPYRLAGGAGIVWLVSITCTLIILLAIIFFVWVPGLPIDRSFALPVVVGVGITLIAGEVLLRLRSRISPRNLFRG
jgi:amino acid transporter